MYLHDPNRFLNEHPTVALTGTFIPSHYTIETYLWEELKLAPFSVRVTSEGYEGIDGPMQLCKAPNLLLNTPFLTQAKY